MTRSEQAVVELHLRERRSQLIHRGDLVVRVEGAPPQHPRTP